MTSLERPLPLPVVVLILAAISVGGFAFGLKNALLKEDHRAVSTAPLAEVSGVPVRDAQPVVTIAPPPAAIETPKPKPAEVVDETPDEAAPVVEAPPVPTEPEKKPEPPPQTTPQRIEDLY